MTATSNAVLSVHDLGQHFGATQVLRGVSLSVQAGERLAIIGPNGAGKSTLFNLISGLGRPSAGRILLNGQRIDGLAPHRIHRMGLARSFQMSSLFGGLSAVENLRCALLGAGGLGTRLWWPASRRRVVAQRADALLAQVGLTARRDVPASHLTYAEQRALELAIAMAPDAPVLLLDEPTAGMNRFESEQMTRLIRTLTQGKTLLMVEHDMAVVFGLADRVAVLVDGELIALGTPDAVRTDARVQAAYLGEHGHPCA